MNKSNLPKMIIPTIYVGAITIVLGSVLFLVSSLNEYLTLPSDYEYATKIIFENIEAVVTTEDITIIRPYLSDTVSINKYFYDFEGDEEEQENSLIYYEGTYMQNSGVDYNSETQFDIISILAGEVIEIEENEIVGTIIKIQHSKDIISVYQGIENVTVEEGTQVNQGQIIATSSESRLDSELENSLHFEVYIGGKLIDPENIYNLDLEGI